MAERQGHREGAGSGAGLHWLEPAGPRSLLLLGAVTIAAVAILAASWKFGLEQWLDPYLPGEHADDPPSERWEFVVVSALLAALALLPSLLALRRLLERNLAATRLSRNVFSLGPQPMLVSTAGGRVLAVNRAWEGLDGRRAEQVVGLPVENACARVGEEPAIRRVTDAVDRTGAWAGEIQGRGMSGDECWSWLSVTRIDGDAGDVRHQVWSLTDITARKRREASVEHAALHDALTGLPNRRLLGDRLDRAASFHRQAGGGLALLYIDIDGLKAVNDRHGHPAGDDVLREAATRLRECVRAEDTMARVGGDEFVVLAAGLRLPAEASVLARRCVHSLDAPFAAGGGGVRIGASIGIALAGPGLDDGEALLGAADRAMYVAKRAGGRQWAFAAISSRDGTADAPAIA